ncbi:MAG: hypothetical protein WC890_04855 [Candidatus Margulisiibacteriota bacterium]
MPAKSILFSQKQPLPLELCLDTSFVIEVFFGIENPSGPIPPKKQASIDFFENRILKETQKRYISTTVHGEMLEKIIEDVVCTCFTDYTKIKYGARSVWKEYYKIHKARIPNLDKKLENAINKFHQWQGDHGISSLPFKYDYTKSIITPVAATNMFYMEVAEYCIHYKILPYDARIIIEGRHRGVDNFVSLDGDFKNVDGITVYSLY